jgi:hypothetical protein
MLEMAELPMHSEELHFKLGAVVGGHSKETTGCRTPIEL